VGKRWNRVVAHARKQRVVEKRKARVRYPGGRRKWYQPKYV
jgi:hypothetical protein